MPCYKKMASVRKVINITLYFVGNVQKFSLIFLLPVSVKSTGFKFCKFYYVHYG